MVAIAGQELEGRGDMLEQGLAVVAIAIANVYVNVYATVIVNYHQDKIYA